MIKCKRKPGDAIAIKWEGDLNKIGKIVDKIEKLIGTEMPVFAIGRGRSIYISGTDSRAEVGDYIVVSKDGEIRVCSPEEFEMLYDIVG